ncbi:hypothetical protein MMC12_007290 [Toensbergia leucococca]|nr:hypothetical protein [Toensbergia leucococca]
MVYANKEVAQQRFSQCCKKFGWMFGKRGSAVASGSTAPAPRGEKRQARLFNIAVPDIWFFSTSSSDPSNCLILRKSPIFAFWIREEEAGSVDDSSGVELCRRRLLLLLLAGLLSSRRRREERGRSGVDAVYDATDQTIWLVAPRVKPMEHFAWPNTWLGTCEIKLQAAGPAPHHN